MEKVIRLTEAQLIKVVENTVARAKEQEEKKTGKMYHLTEAELRSVIKHFVDKSKTI